ncbi:MAG: hypothetical protein JEY99_20175 [Spirochaetales bacterium]|nr:hypothetical protein [Spirochaetales bacterium]
MRRICSKCGKKLDPISLDLLNDDIVSYGLCLTCARIYSFEKQPDFLDTLNIPAMTISKELIIHSLNKKASLLFTKPASQIRGIKHGKISSCPNEKKQKDCGNYSKCMDCVIRNAVLKTFNTGKGVSKLPVPDYLANDSTNRKKDHSFEITTGKVGNLVLLCIEENAI